MRAILIVSEPLSMGPNRKAQQLDYETPTEAKKAAKRHAGAELRWLKGKDAKTGAVVSWTARNEAGTGYYVRALD